MDFQQLLTEAPIGALLGLLAIPVGGALLLTGYLVFAFSRRNKKTKMKLGTQPSAAADDRLPLPDAPPPIPPPQAEPDLDLAVLQSAPQAAVATTHGPVAAVAPAGLQPAELLRLLRDAESGQLIVQVGGNCYQKLSDITDKEVGQYVLNLAAHLLRFTNGVVAVRAGMKPVFNPKEDAGAVPLPLAPAPEKPLVPPPSPEAQAAFLAAIQANPPGQREPAPVRPTGVFGLGRPAVSKPAPVPTLNLADEINEFVQARLSESPLAATTRIDITSNVDGSIRIHVNGQHYASPNDIANPEVKQLIKDSIKAWERS